MQPLFLLVYHVNENRTTPKTENMRRKYDEFLTFRTTKLIITCLINFSELWYQKTIYYREIFNIDEKCNRLYNESIMKSRAVTGGSG